MPTQPTYPGVYVEETPGDLHSIAGVPTSASAFIGAATKGALNKPIRVRSVGEFEQTFGRLRTDLELGYAIRQFFLNGGSDAWIVRASRALAPARVTEAIKALNAAESLNLLAIPGVTHPKVIEFAVDYCARRGIFLLIDPPVSADDVPMMQQFANSLPKSRDAAVYFPRVIIRDPVNGQPRATAPGGTVAGMMARCDAARGVWRAAAGSDATLAGIDALETNLTDRDVTALAAAGVNCLRAFPGRPFIAWSARTLASAERNEPEWKYVPIRRLSIFVETSISRGTRWTVFEPNDEPLWKRLRTSIDEFLLRLWQQQAFAGTKPQDAFFVRCGRDQTMTANDIANGVLNIEIGFAPVRPAEFVIVRIQHRMDGARR